MKVLKREQIRAGGENTLEKLKLEAQEKELLKNNKQVI